MSAGIIKYDNIDYIKGKAATSSYISLGIFEDVIIWSTADSISASFCAKRFTYHELMNNRCYLLRDVLEDSGMTVTTEVAGDEHGVYTVMKGRRKEEGSILWNVATAVAGIIVGVWLGNKLVGR